jgi:hypothetical protein
MVLGQNESNGGGIDDIRGSTLQITCTMHFDLLGLQFLAHWAPLALLYLFGCV